MSDKELALLQILQDILYVDSKLLETSIYYYQFTRKINGIEYKTCLYDIVNGILKDYKDIILTDFYNGFN